MSMIHSSWALLGRRSALMAGTARCRTVRSMTYSTHARAITARPIHSFRPALGGGRVSVSGCMSYLRFSSVHSVGRWAAAELIGRFNARPAPGLPGCSRPQGRAPLSVVRPNRRIPASPSAGCAATHRGALPVGPAGTGAPLALVHGLHPGHRDRPALLDEVPAQRLRPGHTVSPLVGTGEQPRRGVDGELTECNPFEIVPDDRKRHRCARAYPRAVRRHHRGPAGSGGVEVYLAAPVLPEVRGGGEGRV